LEVRGGLLGTARLMMVIEEHGNGQQYVRMRLWPMAQATTFVVALLFAVLASIAAVDLKWAAWGLLNIPAIFLVARTLYECAGALAVIRHSIATNQAPGLEQPPEPFPAPLQPLNPAERDLSWQPCLGALPPSSG
jgi:hypothetical protein